MKNKFFIILSFILVIIMSFGSFVGCGDNSGELPEDPPGQEVTPPGSEDPPTDPPGQGDEPPTDVPETPTLDPWDDDIFGNRSTSSRPLYNDKDELLGNVTYSENGLMAYASEGVKSVKYDWEETDKYSLYTALIPFWRTKNVYNETVTFKSIDDVAQLMYTPTQIISVYDYYLEKEYEQGVDYVIEGNKIKLTQQTKINYWTNYYLDSPGSIIMATADGKFIYPSETEPNRHQISVSYEHNGVWTGAIPVGQSQSIPLSLSKLKNGQKINIGIIGDSITYGRGSSGDFGYGSKTPRYATLIYKYLQARYPASSIVCENAAVGGKASAWGSTADGIGRFTITPDLAIVALGMNDLSTSLSDYYANMEKIVKGLREINPNVEIVLVSPMYGNKEIMRYDSTTNKVTNTWHYGDMPLFEDELVKLSKAYTGLAVAPVSGITKSIYDNGKRFEDVNSNNLNHPNDFIHRVYAQTILKVMLDGDFKAL